MIFTGAGVGAFAGGGGGSSGIDTTGPVPPDGTSRDKAGPGGSALVVPKTESGLAGGTEEATVPTSLGGLFGFDVESTKSVRIDRPRLFVSVDERGIVFLTGCGSSGAGGGTKVRSSRLSVCSSR